MNTSPGTRTYQRASVELNRATQWLKELGLNYDVTRIGQYQRDLIASAEKVENGTLQKLLDKRQDHNLINSTNEVTEIINIYKGLNDFKHGNLVARLKGLIHGLFAPTQEKQAAIIQKHILDLIKNWEFLVKNIVKSQEIVQV